MQRRRRRWRKEDRQGEGELEEQRGGETKKAGLARACVRRYGSVVYTVERDFL